MTSALTAYSYVLALIHFHPMLTYAVKSMVFMRFGALLPFHSEHCPTPSPSLFSSMESSTTKLPPLRLPCHQRDRSAHARNPFCELLVSRWQGEESSPRRSFIGCCHGFGHRGRQSCTSSNPVDQVVVYRTIISQSFRCWASMLIVSLLHIR